MEEKSVIIIGGGLAGLTAAIHLAQKGQKITLFEKDVYPRHKVCGEYLSKEIKPYFDSLQIPLDNLQPKEISRLQYSTPAGRSLEVELPLGAYGVSRFALDNLLYGTALVNGVEVIQERVSKVQFVKSIFKISTKSKEYTAKYVLGGFGKRSVLDKNMDRNFFKKPAPWVAVKAHYQLKEFPDDLVALHNFKGGYCGLSRTESGSINMCYLASYDSFKEHKNPEKFNQEVLRKNPFLKSFLAEATSIFDQPLTIAQISFHKKEAVEDHMLMLGDTAGLIHPLCGNGMAIAIHSAKIAAEELLRHLEDGSSRSQMEEAYKKRWEKTFSRRFSTASFLQRILLREKLAEIGQNVVTKAPFLLPQIIKQTHGRPII